MSWTLQASGKKIELFMPGVDQTNKNMLRFTDESEARRYLSGFATGYDNILNMQKALAAAVPGLGALCKTALVERLVGLLVSRRLALRRIEAHTRFDEPMFACGIPRGVWQPIKPRVEQGSTGTDLQEPEMKPRKIYVRIPAGACHRKVAGITFVLGRSDQSGSRQGSRSLDQANEARDNFSELTYTGLDPISRYDLQSEYKNSKLCKAFSRVS